MIHYENSTIYLIRSQKPNGEWLYWVGATTDGQLSKRIGSHRVAYKKWKEGNGKFQKDFLIFNENMFPASERIELVDCNNRAELKSRQTYHINRLKEEYGDALLNDVVAPIPKFVRETVS
jgi:hypothetical protein